ncbi:MAG: DUF6775 family putative metallopeptidase [Candidatus Saliniplasma sp.]
MSNPVGTDPLLPLEIELEKKMLQGRDIKGILYDGWKLSKLMFDILPDKEHHHHVIVTTDRLIATLEKRRCLLSCQSRHQFTPLNHFNRRYRRRLLIWKVTTILNPWSMETEG